jgi:hypothetical protein
MSDECVVVTTPYQTQQAEECLRETLPYPEKERNPA